MPSWTLNFCIVLILPVQRLTILWIPWYSTKFYSYSYTDHVATKETLNNIISCVMLWCVIVILESFLFMYSGTYNSYSIIDRIIMTKTFKILPYYIQFNFIAIMIVYINHKKESLVKKTITTPKSEQKLGQLVPYPYKTPFKSYSII